MKNKFTVIAASLVLFAAILGCSWLGDKGVTTNKSVTESGVEAVLGEEKIGVQECDDVLDMLTVELNNPEDSFVTKAGKGFVLNKIKESVRQSIETNKGDTAKLAKDCGKFKAQLQKYKADEEKNKSQQ